ncbi:MULTISPECIES: HAMP domain-containing sensor histidine kinase [unclassified Actinomadura]|uniref:sensor histidine kinase n=1 Tax=unclassified Actinomadura TaxID=2626254 RepID=UPI00135AF35C|nr:HAMP domain-containing sensor histidine kinase [Actinomadura sp. K4S16]
MSAPFTALGSLLVAAIALAAAALHVLAGVGRPGVLAAVMAGLAAVAVGSARWGVAHSARGSLRPVERLRRELDRLTEDGASGRVAVPATGDEIERLAERVNELLGRLERAVLQRRAFVSDASHELRTPIAGLRTRIELALSAPDDGEAADTLRQSLADIDRLHRIVEDLLVLARIDSGDLPVREPVDLGALVEAEAARRTPPVPTVVKAEPGLVVAGDRQRLARAVGSLLANAERYAAAQIEVEARADGDGAVVEVHDDGPGIPPADRDRVFERFARLDPARSRDKGGSGLGLPIAREIARAHGGTVRVADGAYGARLVLRLPLAR